MLNKYLKIYMYMNNLFYLKNFKLRPPETGNYDSPFYYWNEILKNKYFSCLKLN